MNKPGLLDYTGHIGVLGGSLMAVAQALVYLYAPLEKAMGAAQKIFYFHLPVAWWCFVSFFVACVAGVAYLKTRDLKWDRLSASVAEIGLICATLALITGMVWARHSWNVWWTWDPRLTTTLILWFIYAAYLAVRSMGMSPHRRASICAGIAIIGFLDVPLVFLSARLWRSIHPAVFASRGGGMTSEMAVAVIFSVLSFGVVWLGLILFRYRQQTLISKCTALMFEDDSILNKGR